MAIDSFNLTRALGSQSYAFKCWNNFIHRFSPLLTCQTAFELLDQSIIRPFVVSSLALLIFESPYSIYFHLSTIGQ